MEILAKSTFCVRANARSTSSGPSKPSRLTTSASCLPIASSAASHASTLASKFGSGSGGSAALMLASAMRLPRCGKAVNHSCADYTDSGGGAQNFGNAGLSLADVERLLLPQNGTGTLIAGKCRALQRGGDSRHALALGKAAIARQHDI